MFKWIRTLFDNTARSGDSIVPSPARAAAGTPRDLWTISEAYFDTSGWRLSEASATTMTWVADCGSMTLTRHDAGAERPHLRDLPSARRDHRAHAAESRGGLVSVEPVGMPSGALALEVITKHPHHQGFGFDGRLYIEEVPDTYMIRIAADEGTTGVREALVTAVQLQLGEIDITAMMSGPVDPATGGRAISGWTMDPYDEAYDEQSTYSVSDDPRIDDVVPAHPLSVIRRMLQQIEATWEHAASSVPRDISEPLPGSPGPKRRLSDDVVRELHRRARR